MELDDLKAGWKNRSIKHSLIEEKSMEDLNLILKEKTSGTLFAIKKNYEKLISFTLVSIAGTLLLSGFLPWLMGHEGPVYAWPITFDRVASMLVMLLLSVTFIFFYWAKSTTTTTDIGNNDLKAVLSESIKKLKRSFRQEVIFVFLLFITWTTIARSHSQFSGYGNFWDIFRMDILLSIAALVLLLGSYLIARYRHYKRHISELQEYLKEFDLP